MPPAYAYRPMAFSPPPDGPQTLALNVQQLGQGVRFRPDGLALFNEPLIQRLVMGGAATPPLLAQHLLALARLQNPPLAPLLETLYAANRLADAGVSTISDIYPAASLFNTHPHPLTQIYLAGLYRKLNRPESFGPLLATLTHQAVSAYGGQAPMTALSEEVGGAVLQLIANRTAEETVKRLRPYLSPQGPY